MIEIMVNITPVISIKKSKNDLMSPALRPCFNIRRLNGSDNRVARANKKANAKADCAPIPIGIWLLVFPK